MVHPLSPTSALPSLVSLHTCDATRVEQALYSLRDVYFPRANSPTKTVTDAVPGLKQSLSVTVLNLRPKRARCYAYHDGVPDSGYASAEEDGEDDEQGEDIEDEATEEELDILRSDELQRGYAIKWLTGMVKRGEAWVEAASATTDVEEQEARAACLEDAARLLARFSGNDVPEQALMRTFIFPLHALLESRVSHHPGRFSDDTLSTEKALSLPITVELNDAPVDGTDHTAVGLQSWGSAIMFAERMCKDPDRYLGVLTTGNCLGEPGGKTKTRLLELGAGTGLLSITAAKILSRANACVEVKATDYHAGVLENLAWNVSHNHVVGVSVERLDWSAVASPELPGVDADGEEGEGGSVMYDVVLAADVVYYPEHARWIKGCVERMMKKTGVFWLIIPVRAIGRHEGLGKTVEEAFSSMDTSVEVKWLAIVRQEEVERVDGVGRADEGGYILYEIRWV